MKNKIIVTWLSQSILYILIVYKVYCISQLALGNSLGPNSFMPIAPMGAVNKIEITAMFTSRVPHSMSSGIPNSLAIFNANGAKIA